jgi:ribosomal protein L27
MKGYIMRPTHRGDDVTPGEILIEEFGSAAEAGRRLGVSRNAVTLWAHGGGISQFMMQKILEVARDEGLNITAEDLIHGRD